MKTWTIALPNNLQVKLQAAYNKATGGFQGHARRVIEATLEDGRLQVDDELIGQTYRYAYCYGQGGWQNVCKALLSCIALELTGDTSG